MSRRVSGAGSCASIRSHSSAADAAHSERHSEPAVRAKRAHRWLSFLAAIAAVAAKCSIFGPLGFARIDLIGKRLLLRCIKLCGLAIEALHGIQKVEVRHLRCLSLPRDRVTARPRNRDYSV